MDVNKMKEKASELKKNAGNITNQALEKANKGKDVALKKVNQGKDKMMEVMDVNGDGTIDIEDIIIVGLRTPGVKISREKSKSIFISILSSGIMIKSCKTTWAVVFNLHSFVISCTSILWLNGSTILLLSIPPVLVDEKIKLISISPSNIILSFMIFVFWILTFTSAS